MLKDNKKDLTIIFVTYNSSHIITKALDQLIDINSVDKDNINNNFDIKIIDNNSCDNLEEVLNNKYKGANIELIQLANNIGFGKANNFILNKITSKYALLLNPDAIITKESIATLLKMIAKDTNTSLMSTNFTNNINNIYLKKDNSLNIQYVKEISGAAMLMRVTIFKQIGFFDENLFLYAEDCEISNRSIINGYKNAIITDIYTYHIDHNSTKTNNNFSKYILLLKRYYYKGWATTYLKRRKKNILLIFIKNLYKFIFSFYYLITFRFKYAICNCGKSIGATANLFNIKIFNNINNKAIVKKIIII